jgi:hypothetical protein
MFSVGKKVMADKLIRHRSTADESNTYDTHVHHRIPVNTGRSVLLEAQLNFYTVLTRREPFVGSPVYLHK